MFSIPAAIISYLLLLLLFLVLMIYLSSISNKNTLDNLYQNKTITLVVDKMIKYSSIILHIFYTVLYCETSTQNGNFLCIPAKSTISDNDD